MPYSQLLKKRSSSIGWALLIYHIVFTVIAVGVAYLPLILARSEAASHGHSLSRLRESILKRQATQNAWGYIIAVCVGFILLLLWKKDKFTFGTIFHQGRAMTGESFWSLLILSTSGQAIYRFMSTTLGATGYPDTGISGAFGPSFDAYAFGMFLYTTILAPVFEEIFFRGAVLRHLQPYGKRIAILGSAFLFGIFHGNLYQIPFAFYIGLFYGYTAVEYSIFWSMLLHMINNLLLGDILTRLVFVWGPSAVASLLNIIVYGSAVVAIIILVSQAARIALYHRANPMVNGSCKAFFTAPGIWVFAIYMAVHTVLSWNYSMG